MRDRFHEQLQQLSEALITMGALCEEAISDAAKSYFTGDRRLGERAGQLEQQIDQQQRDIESLCMQLLLRQQPVARDLRAVSAALKMISDMERIGDQAADIAEIARDIESRELCRRVEVPVQRYSNRADLPGGSTLGNISTSHLSIPSVDIGLPQLAMHSCCEVAGVRDTEALARVMTVYFATGMHRLPGGGMALA